MEDGRFVFFEFMGVDGGDTRARETNPDREESNVLLDSSQSLRQGIHCMEKNSGSLSNVSTMEDGQLVFYDFMGLGGDIRAIEISVSGDNTSTGTSKTDKGKQVIEYKESDEKSSGCLSQEPTDASSELSFAENKNWGFEVGEGSNLNKSCSMSKDFDGALALLALNEGSNLNHRNLNRGLTWVLSEGFTTHKKRKPRENPKHSSTVNKRRRVEPEAVPRRRMADQLRLGPGNDPWVIRKRLFKSDLGDNSRLLLASELVESHILPHRDADRRAQIHNGLQVSVYDCDTNSQQAMVFKRWRNGAYVFIKKWIQNFVSRRDLELNDEIGLYWDTNNSRFNFSVLHKNRAARN